MSNSQHQGPYWIDPYDPDSPFPPVELALKEPDGLLAVGGDLSPHRLLRAYRQGIFPWYSSGQPILWWSPDPRSVLYPADLKISRSLRKTLRRRPFRITLNTAFHQVMHCCALPRKDNEGTWITAEMTAAYCRLHEMGHAHSIEAWEDDQLVGGLYGVGLGKIFFGESMFSRRTDASKIAFVHLVRLLQRNGIRLIDCQVSSEHLESLGAVNMPRAEFTQLLPALCDQDPGPRRLQMNEMIEPDELIRGSSEARPE